MPIEVISGLPGEPNTVNVGAEPQLVIVPAGGFGPTMICALWKLLLASNRFPPMMMWPASIPSFG